MVVARARDLQVVDGAVVAAAVRDGGAAHRPREQAAEESVRVEGPVEEQVGHLRARVRRVGGDDPPHLVPVVGALHVEPADDAAHAVRDQVDLSGREIGVGALLDDGVDAAGDQRVVDV